MDAILVTRGTKKVPNYVKGDFFSYNGIEFDASLVKEKPDSIKFKDFLEIISLMHENGIELNKDSVKIGVSVYERRKSTFLDSFLQNYKQIGNINCYETLLKVSVQSRINEIEEDLSNRFKEKFRGRVPQIIHAIAIATFLYDFSPEEVVANFNVQSVRSAMNHLSPVESIVLLMGAKDISSTAIFDSASAKYAVRCYCFSLKGKGECYKVAGDFIASHPQTSEKILKKIAKKANELEITNKSTVESITTQFGNLSSASEVQKIEKAYKECGFKFRKCQFDLKFSDTISGNYRMEILRPGDTRMAYLGDFTSCCQRLHDVGESAMMHGLLNPKAGFWCMTDKRTGRVVAQAEIWEKENDPNSLVFDNIEFANDAEIGLYRKDIGEWLKESPYENIYMGCGYNTLLENGDFRTVGAITPWVTPYEVYVISHEQESEAPVFNSEEEATKALEEGRVTYFDYVYCDSEHSSVAMKENGIVEPYFVLDVLPERTNEDEQEYDEYMEEEDEDLEEDDDLEMEDY